MKEIVNRMKKPSTKLGKTLQNIGYILSVVITAVGSCLEYINVIPHDWFPVWLKTTVVLCGIASVVIGKLTVKTDA